MQNRDKKNIQEKWKNKKKQVEKEERSYRKNEWNKQKIYKSTCLFYINITSVLHHKKVPYNML